MAAAVALALVFGAARARDLEQSLREDFRMARFVSPDTLKGPETVLRLAVGEGLFWGVGLMGLPCGSAPLGQDKIALVRLTSSDLARLALRGALGVEPVGAQEGDAARVEEGDGDGRQ